VPGSYCARVDTLFNMPGVHVIDVAWRGPGERLVLKVETHPDRSVARLWAQLAQRCSIGLRAHQASDLSPSIAQPSDDPTPQVS